MESNKTVTVLTPNGRRQNVKVNPNTTILQIIEEVCKKHDFEPTEYDVKHHRKVLDTSCTMRFSGLPNNAQLELVKSEKTRSYNPVLIGLQMEDGVRLTGEFQPNTTIMDILINLCPEHANPDANPVVIYTRREIYGQPALQNTTLKQLGLTGGRAILRLIHRSPEQLKTQANVSAPLSHVTKTLDSVKVMDNKSTINKNQHPQPLPLLNAEDKIKGKNIANVVKQEREKERFGHEQPIKKSRDNTPSPSKFLTNAEGKLIKTNVDNESSNLNKIQAVETTKNEIENEENIVDEEFVFLGDRNAIAFSQEMARTVRTEDLPDDFFELTIGDAKKLIRDIKKTRMELESKQLETKATRYLKESQKQLAALHKYRQAIIRIVFPDHTVLQGTFKPVEKIIDVAEFVKEYLEDRSINFHLYTAPPKEILNNESRLIETGCVPTAIIYFGTDTPSRDNKYLKKEVLNKLVSPITASNATIKMRKESVRKIREERLISDNESSDDLMNMGPSTSNEPSPKYEDYKPRDPKPEQKTPKWFKMAK